MSPEQHSSSKIPMTLQGGHPETMMRVNSDNDNDSVLVVIPRGVDGQTVQSSVNADNTLQSNYEPNQNGESRNVVVPLRVQMADTASVTNKPLTPVSDNNNGKRNSLIIICSNENEDPLDPNHEGNRM